MLNIHTVPWLLRIWFPKYIWRVPTNEKIIYLTFDDGPIPIVTEYVLQLLKTYQAKATFFCVGDNVYKHPAILLKIVGNGHAIGNHTYNHLNGWNTNNDAYLKNIESCKNILENNFPDYKDKLFRPPYGKIRISVAKILLKKYKIIMWDVLSGDYDKNLSPEVCLNNCIKYTKSGTIIVFHDSLKAEENLRYILPKYLEYFSKLGYKFEAIF